MPALERRYDQDESSASGEEEDFVNAARAPSRPSSSATARPASRTSSHQSGGSRSSRRSSRPKVHSSSSSESTDSEEDRQLQADLRDADLEQGVVRGEPVESRTERIMRSMKKGGSGGASRQQQYSAIGGDDDGVSRKTSSRSSRSSRTAGGDGKRHHKKRDKNARLYALDKSNPSSGGGDPSAPGALAKDDKKKPTRWWLWALVAILLIVVIIGVVVAVMHFSKKKDSTDLSTTNSTAANSTLGEDNMGNSTSPLSLDSSDSHGSMSGISGSVAASGLSGLIGAATSDPNILTTTGTKTFNDGQYHPSSTGAPAQNSNTGNPIAAFSTLSGAQNAQPTQSGAQQNQGFSNVGQWGSFSSDDGSDNVLSAFGAMPTSMPVQQQGGVSSLSNQQHQPAQQSNGDDHGWSAFSNAQQTRSAPGAQPTGTQDGQDQQGQPSSPSSMGASPWQGQGQGAQSHSQGQQGQNGYGWNQPQPTGQPGQQQPQQPSSNSNGQQQNGWNGQQNGWNGQQQQPQNDNGIVPVQTKTALSSFGNGPSPTRSGAPGASPSSGGGHGQWPDNNGSPAAQPSSGGGYGHWPSNGDSPNAQPSSGGGYGHWPSSSDSPDGQAHPSSIPLGVGPVVVGQGQDSHGMFSNSTAYQAEKPETYQTYEGKGTWFEASMHYGACGWATNNTDFVVAISNDMWLNSSAAAPSAAPAPSASKKPVSFASSSSSSSQNNSTTPAFCGAEVLVTNKDNGRSIKAWVTERCGYCEGSAALDLSIPVFTALFPDSSSQQEVLDIGVVDLLWGFTGEKVGLNSTLAASSGNSTASASGDDSSGDEQDGEKKKESGGGWFSGWFGSD
ncbi:hypothetical protein NBRC10512v2_006338 [Rhodotorula toruloides]|uniref:Expansin family protein n=1 Tax=Rhodotorula toruloides (strain NP11) TaxID=1130832 RepID=M7WLW4_RHOT1|nr:uncharacterized protein RHTO_01557 [Rhodotorula toruloides NP11]EMS21497.1 hypothetical protein RHTO_01557 [Rhodotorula toruloides NP11]